MIIIEPQSQHKIINQDSDKIKLKPIEPQNQHRVVDQDSDEIKLKPTTEPQNQHKVADQDSDEIELKRAALNECQQTLADNRQKASRPDNVDHMSLEQLQEEKLSVQRVLLEFEKQYGRPVRE